MKATGSKLFASLGQEIQTVNDEIEFRNFILPLEIVTQVTDIMECQRSFTAALGVPNYAVLCTLIQFLLNCQSSKELRVAHNVLL